MKNVFLTGMVRSGTTLLEKLLSNHSEISFLSQPFPQLFINTKKDFHKSINHKELYYVLNHMVGEENYTINEFTSYLESTKLLCKRVNQSLLQKYSGQLTKVNQINCNEEKSGTFSNWYNKLCYLEAHKNNVNYYGSKEVMCEEFIPYFIKRNIKSLIILRDPRDVMASIHYGKGSAFVGNHRPLLFDIQNWRKSFYFALANKNNECFYYLKYEDLVDNPLIELNNIGKFLKVSQFNNNLFKDGILAQNNTLWKGNSSFGLDNIISNKSIGGYKNILNKNTIAFIETLCRKEMSYLGYLPKTDREYDTKLVLNYQEDFEIEDINLKEKYEKGGIMRKLEIERLRGKHKNSFIYPEIYKTLRNQDT